MAREDAGDEFHLPAGGAQPARGIGGNAAHGFRGRQTLRSRTQLRERHAGGPENVVEPGVIVPEIKDLAAQPHGVAEPENDLHIRELVLRRNGRRKPEEMPVRHELYVVALQRRAGGQHIVRAQSGVGPEQVRYNGKLYRLQRMQQLVRPGPHLDVEPEGDQIAHRVGGPGQDNVGQSDALRLVHKFLPDGVGPAGDVVVDIGPRRQLLVVVVQHHGLAGGSAVAAGASAASGQRREHGDGALILHAAHAVDDGAA